MGMTLFQSEESYLRALSDRAALPAGFSCATASFEFSPRELAGNAAFPMKVSAILLDDPSPAYACVFTANKFPGAPVVIGRDRISNKTIEGIIINNKIANVCAPQGVEDALRILSEFAALTGKNPENLLPASTGVIGWKLPVQEMVSVLPDICNSLQRETILPVAKAIMTTDRFPKVRSAKVGAGSIVAIAKGAGMIEPNMGTLLVFILTDIEIDRDELRSIHREVIDRTFNRISVDGDQSTSDIALTVSSCTKPPVNREAFREQLFAVCAPLAEDVVRNGEGTSHVVRVRVTEAPDETMAVQLGKAIANSPLVKTAIYGNDPNVGRIIMAIGDFLSAAGAGASTDVDAEDIWVELGGHRVFENNRFSLDESREKSIKEHFEQAFFDSEAQIYPPHERCVEITVGLKAGKEAAEVLGSDLSYGYVKENADYRT